MKRSIDAVAEEIHEVEGFKIRFVPSNDAVGRARVDVYPYERAARSNWTVKKCQETRFAPNYPGFDVVVLDGHGAQVHGKTLLKSVRATYHDGR